MTEETKNLIAQAKNICLIPSEHEPESLTSCLALFYTLKELGKNVNLISENFPKNLEFLIPPVDFISSPKNFVISIPRTASNISQIYYEKTEEYLKIHLTTDKGSLKKDDISFYFKEAKPDLIITFGIQDFKKQLDSKLDSFGFLLGSPIINIDNRKENILFGQVNLVEHKSLSEISLRLIRLIDENLISKNVADCIMSGLIMYYENFKTKIITPEVFQIAAEMIKKGANNQQIVDNLYRSSEAELNFLGKLLQNIKNEKELSFANLSSNEFENFSGTEIDSLMQKIKGIGIQNNLLVLWQSHNSEPVTKGFFYSKSKDVTNKVSSELGLAQKNGLILISNTEEDAEVIKEKILKLLT